MIPQRLFQSRGVRHAGFFASVKNAGVGLLFAAALAGFAPAASAIDNDGLGPLAVRAFFPPAVPFLDFVPSATVGLPPGKFSFTYQYAAANTYINTQYAGLGVTPVIGQAELDRGLSAADFPATGYGAYIDVEAIVHTVRFRYGLSRSLELGLDQSWISYGGGGLDGTVESVESAVGGLNPQRLVVPRNAFHYYLVKDGRLLAATSTPFDTVPQDPVLSLKWTWSAGGEFLPAVALKITSKVPLDGAATAPRSLVSSGRADYGAYLLLAKAVGHVVAHFQFGQTMLDQVSGDYADTVVNRLFALEFRQDSRNSWLLQMTTNSSIFKHSLDSRRADFHFTRFSDLIAMGHKFQGKSVSFDWGFVEDINSYLNATDIVFFFTLGWTW